MRTIAQMSIAIGLFAQVGCAPLLVGAGAAGAATAYEANNKEKLDDLEAAYKRGEISDSEYRSRRDQIEDSSVVY